MTTLREVRRLYWQHRFGRLSAKQLLDVYRQLLDSSVKRKQEATRKLNDWPLGSSPSNLLAELDHCGEETLHAIERNDADGARQSLGRAMTYPQQLEQLCRATDKLNEARQQLEKFPRTNMSWPIANKLLVSADRLLRQPIDRSQPIPHEPSVKVIILSQVIGQFASESDSAEAPAEMSLAPDDMETLNQRLSSQLEKLDMLFPPDDH